MGGDPVLHHRAGGHLHLPVQGLPQPLEGRHWNVRPDVGGVVVLWFGLV